MPFKQQKAPPSHLDGAEREEKLQVQCLPLPVWMSSPHSCVMVYRSSPLPRSHRLSDGPNSSATRPRFALETVQVGPLRRIADEDPCHARENLLRSGIAPLASHPGNCAPVAIDGDWLDLR